MQSDNPVSNQAMKVNPVATAMTDEATMPPKALRMESASLLFVVADCGEAVAVVADWETADGVAPSDY